MLENDIKALEDPLSAQKKKKYSPICLSLTSSDTEDEEEQHRTEKRERIEQIKNQIQQ